MVSNQFWNKFLFILFLVTQKGPSMSSLLSLNKNNIFSFKKKGCGLVKQYVLKWILLAGKSYDIPKISKDVERYSDLSKFLMFSKSSVP